MTFESFESVMYSDTPVPDIFFSEYLPSMKSEYVKVYIFMLFLKKHNKNIAFEDMSKKLGLGFNVLKDALLHLESIGVINREGEDIILMDLKQKEINKIYRLKTTSTPQEVAVSCERNKKRNKIISAINNTFFQGVMSSSWYRDIDSWFDKYNFDEDVMYALFRHCYDHNALTKSYICKVADNWQSKAVKNSFDLDRYSLEQQRFRKIKLNIVKKLKLGRNLTQYEDEYVEKWVVQFNYDFAIIEIALKKTTGKTNPNFRYIDAIISEWNKNDLRTKDEIMFYEKQRSKRTASKSTGFKKAVTYNDFEHKHDDSVYLDNYYSDLKD